MLFGNYISRSFYLVRLKVCACLLRLLLRASLGGRLFVFFRRFCFVGLTGGGSSCSGTDLLCLVSVCLHFGIARVAAIIIVCTACQINSYHWFVCFGRSLFRVLVAVFLPISESFVGNSRKSFCFQDRRYCKRCRPGLWSNQ